MGSSAAAGAAGFMNGAAGRPASGLTIITLNYELGYF